MNTHSRVPLARFSFRPLVAATAAVAGIVALLWFLSPLYWDRDEIELPYVASAEPDESPGPGFIISVQRDGSVWLEGECVSLSQLEETLRVDARLCRNQDGYSDRRIWIRADREAPWGSVQAIINLRRRDDIRVWRLTFLTRQAPD